MKKFIYLKCVLIAWQNVRLKKLSIVSVNFSGVVRRKKYYI